MNDDVRKRKRERNNESVRRCRENEKKKIENAREELKKYKDEYKELEDKYNSLQKELNVLKSLFQTSTSSNTSSSENRPEKNNKDEKSKSEDDSILKDAKKIEPIPSTSQSIEKKKINIKAKKESKNSFLGANNNSVDDLNSLNDTSSKNKTDYEKSEDLNFILNSDQNQANISKLTDSSSDVLNDIILPFDHQYSLKRKFDDT